MDERTLIGEKDVGRRDRHRHLPFEKDRGGLNSRAEVLHDVSFLSMNLNPSRKSINKDKEHRNRSWSLSLYLWSFWRLRLKYCTVVTIRSSPPLRWSGTRSVVLPFGPLHLDCGRTTRFGEPTELVLDSLFGVGKSFGKTKFFRLRGSKDE